MLAIQVNNEFIDLPAQISLELERNNPFLSDDDIQGQFSLGLTIRYTEKNYRLLQYIGNFYKTNSKYTVDAAIYDAGIFRYAGKLVITQHQSNMNNIEQTVWTGFFTIGSSSFLQSIQDVLLQDVDFGGERTFNYTTSDPDDGSGGFWQHIHAAVVPDAFPYCFYPINNEGWAPDYISLKWMNPFLADTQEFDSIFNAVTLCPALYLSFVLNKIFENFGWKLSGEILNDTGFKKITIPSFQAINWCTFTRMAQQIVSVNPRPVITFDLADHVPPDVTIGSFLVSLKNRMGWYFEFDSGTKTAYLHGYQKIIDASVKDWTKYVQSNYTSDYTDPAKIYSLVNNIDSSDEFPVLKEIDESAIVRVNSVGDLPSPTAANEDLIGYVFLDNSYYQCQLTPDSDPPTFEWVFYAHNIGDYQQQPDFDTTIESDISTMPTLLMLYGTGNSAKVPVCSQPGNFRSNVSPWAVRFLFYHGMYPSTNGQLYPFASCDNTAISGTDPTGAWVLPYRHEFGVVNDGTYDYWWKDWLRLLSIQDSRTFTLALPVTELKKFSFSDIIFINNVFFVAQSVKEMLPYKDLIEMKMKRIY